jgi:hypothetical protein
MVVLRRLLQVALLLLLRQEIPPHHQALRVTCLSAAAARVKADQASTFGTVMLVGRRSLS